MDSGMFIQVLEHQRLILDYMYVSATAILIYDYLVTLHLEVEFIWFSRWTYTKVLFLLIRYIALASTILMLHNQIFLDLSEQNCKKVFPVVGYTMIVQMCLAEFVIAIRTWAVWNRRKIIFVIIGIPLLICAVWSSVAAVRFYNALEYSSPPYPGYRGCFLLKAPTQSLWPSYALLTILDTTVLTLMAISAFLIYRSGNFSNVSHVIHRDGVLFYVYLLCITVTTLAVTLSLPVDLKFLMDPMLDSLYPVFVSRIFLNMRQAVNRGQHTELHTGYQRPMAFATPLQFIPHERTLDSSALAQSSMGSRGTDCNDDRLDP